MKYKKILESHILNFIIFSSIFILTVYLRHYFDDEIASLQFISTSEANNFFDLVKYTNSIDVSPPIQYLIPYFFLKIFGTAKYSSLISLPIYYLIFFFSKNIY